MLPLSNSRPTNYTETDASDVQTSLNYSRLNLRKYFFINGVVQLWNTSRWGGSSVNNQCIQRSPRQLLPWNRMWTLWKAYGLTNVLYIIVHNLIMYTNSNYNMSISQVIYIYHHVHQTKCLPICVYVSIHQIKCSPN